MATFLMLLTLLPLDDEIVESCGLRPSRICLPQTDAFEEATFADILEDAEIELRAVGVVVANVMGAWTTLMSLVRAASTRARVFLQHLRAFHLPFYRVVEPKTPL